MEAWKRESFSSWETFTASLNDQLAKIVLVLILKISTYASVMWIYAVDET